MKLSGRFVFRKDDDGHWYFIPVEFADEFEDWVAVMEDDESYWQGHDFSSYRSLPPEAYVIIDWEQNE